MSRPFVETARRSEDEIAFDCALGVVLRRRRQVAGLSQEEFGNLFGVTFQQVQKYESGRNRMPIARLIRMAAACGATVEELIEEALTETGRRVAVEEAPPYSQVLETAALLHRAPPPYRGAVLSLTKAVLGDR